MSSTGLFLSKPECSLPPFLSVRQRCLLTSALSISSLNPSRLLFLASWPLCPRSFSFLYLSCSIPSSDRILRAEPRPSPLTRDPVFLGSSELHIYPFISASFRELCSSFVFSIFCLTPIPFSCLPLFPFVWIIDLGREFDLQSLRKWYLNDFRLTIPFRIARRHVWNKGNCVMFLYVFLEYVWNAWRSGFDLFWLLLILSLYRVCLSCNL